MKFFIAGTDTNVGKTTMSVGILKAFNRLGYSALGLKPIASGCMVSQRQLINDDTLALFQHSSIKLPLTEITPFAFQPAIAPHLAAEEIACELSAALLSLRIQQGLSYEADVHLIEGAGGWHTPLNQTETLADFVIQQALPVVLVVGMRLGCLNHSILTHQAIQATGTPIIGWIANCIEPEMLYYKENIATLKTWLSSPFLGAVAYNQPPEDALDIHTIIQFFEQPR